MSIMATALQASDIDEIHREDESSGHNGSGYERDETDTSFYQLVRRLVGDGDDRARTAGRRACRTYADMVPGVYDRQPILHMTTATITFMASQPCQSCGGQGGQTVDTSSDGVTRQNWVICQTCRGSGAA
ncbi:hypothetical protein ACFV8E_32310 [Streptomyces sp. NPDC059849]|uniref:hypothetical protein n=1 Tax=Streptomyces sp. NPDC059849 TaxID=3346969 RepID=UPI00364B634F